jgi:hypothetical protein
MTALQDAQATEWRDVAIGEIPEIIIYRDKRGTFTRSVTITFIVAVLIMLLVQGKSTLAVPFYGIGVFLPIAIMGWALRRHIKQHFTGRARTWGMAGATLAAILSASVFLGQLFGKWEEGGWIRLITFTTLFTSAHLLLISPIGYRNPVQIHRIVREKARMKGAMASIVEWQSLKMQEYRYGLLVGITRFFELFGIRRPLRYEPPVLAGDYDHALHVDDPSAPSLLMPYLEQAAAARPNGHTSDAGAEASTVMAPERAVAAAWGENPALPPNGETPGGNGSSLAAVSPVTSTDQTRLPAEH